MTFVEFAAAHRETFRSTLQGSPFISSHFVYVCICRVRILAQSRFIICLETLVQFTLLLYIYIAIV